MTDPTPGVYEGHALSAEPVYSVGGEPLVEVECWFTLPDDHEEPAEADGA